MYFLNGRDYKKISSDSEIDIESVKFNTALLVIDAAQTCPCTRRQFCKSNIPLIFVNDDKERIINFPSIQVYRQGILDTGQIIVLL